MGEFVLHLSAGNALDLVAVLHQLDQGARLADVLEIRRDHRVQRLLDQLFDITKALHHQWGFLVVDMDDHRQRQGWLKGVLGDQ